MLTVLLALLLAAGSVTCFAQTSDMTLSVKGKPVAAIVVSVDAIESERTAAKELAVHLKLITGGDFPIVASASDTLLPTRIFIGQTLTVRSMLPGIDFSKLDPDAIVIRREGSDLILAGDRPRGTLYAVYTFMEDMGCRWWTAEASHIPKKSTLRVRVSDVTYAPPFMSRETYFQQVVRRNPELAPRLKLNGHHQPIPTELGSHYSIVGWVHTFFRLLPPAEYFEGHPEWYSEIDGKRTHHDTQLCLTNDEMRAELTRKALEWIKKDPDAGIISVSQNDCFSPCQCADCKAVVEEEGSESGPVIRFVNAVAEEIEKHYPDFLVETLAYQYTRKAPAKVKPRHNVVVRLCSIESDFSQPLTSPRNEAFYNDLQEWKAISTHLYVWDYIVNFANLLVPHPNWRALGPNIRLFAKSNVISVFEQGDGFNPDANFAGMKTWLVSRLMWNPSLNENKLIDEFLAGYYGPAAPKLREYIDFMTDAAVQSGVVLSCFNQNHEWMTPDVLNRATALFDEAEKAVSGNEELTRRVRLQRASVDHARLLLLRPADGRPTGDDLERALDNVFALSDETGNIHLHEAFPMPTHYRDMLRNGPSD